MFIWDCNNSAYAPQKSPQMSLRFHWQPVELIFRRECTLSRKSLGGRPAFAGGRSAFPFFQRFSERVFLGKPNTYEIF